MKRWSSESSECLLAMRKRREQMHDEGMVFRVPPGKRQRRIHLEGATLLIPALSPPQELKGEPRAGMFRGPARGTGGVAVMPMTLGDASRKRAT